MSDELPYEKILQEYLKNELKVLNAHLPRYRKPLSELLDEEYPYVICNDGSSHFFKKKELEYLASIIDSDEQEVLLLPILIELMPNQSEVRVLCKEGVEEKIISRILDMPIVREQKSLLIYKPQLGLLRRTLKTTTQYVFSPKILE
jgi:hypothetical protein